jgi:hypothetical protein
MGPIFHLDPFLRSPRDVASIVAFRNDTLEAHSASRSEKVWAYFAKLKWRYEHAFWATAQ